MKIPTIDPATIFAANKNSLQSPSKIDAQKEQAALKQSCQDFEAIFIQSMLKAMRKTIPESTLFTKSSGQKMYEEMMDTELATHSARHQSLGMAEDLYQQLEKLLPGK